MACKNLKCATGTHTTSLMNIALWLMAVTILSAIVVTNLSITNAVIIQLLCAVGLIYASLRWIPLLEGSETTMAQCNVFLFLAEITAVRLTGATDYFFTADCPSGSGVGGMDPTPGFTYDFYLGWMPIVASIASMIGVWVFSKYLQFLPLRYVFQGIAVTRILFSGLKSGKQVAEILGTLTTSFFFISEVSCRPLFQWRTFYT